MRKYIELESAIVATIVIMAITFIASTAQEAPSVAPSPPQGLSGECWEKISECIEKNGNNSMSKPELDPSSPSFNATEYLCCDLMQQAAVNDKKCFCIVNTFVKENPSEAANTTAILSICKIVDNSVASLNSFCA